MNRVRQTSRSQFPVLSSQRSTQRFSFGTDTRRPRTALCAFTLFCLALSSVAFAKDNPSYTQFGHNITIGPNDQVRDLTCFACSIRVRGQVAGDVTALGGSIVIEDNAQVAGDITTFGGDIRLDQGAKVTGDATVFGGQIRRDPAATISGDVTSMGGHGWLVPILLAPFLALGLLVAFVIWLVQRRRGPSAPAIAA
jgi:cytoskeletal protein CcmA (bactofilin family)